MKKLLIIPMLFACYMVMGQNAAKIIGKPYQLKNIEVAQHDFPNAQTWNDAIAKCKGLGNGWRLPTSDELNKLYNNKNKIGGFKSGWLDDFYWSSTEASENLVYYQCFGDGQKYTSEKRNKNNLYYVRAVRTK